MPRLFCRDETGLSQVRDFPTCDSPFGRICLRRTSAFDFIAIYGNKYLTWREVCDIM